MKKDKTQLPPLTFKRLEGKILKKDRNDDPNIQQIFQDLRLFSGTIMWKEVPLYDYNVEQMLRRFMNTELHLCDTEEQYERGKALLFILDRANQVQATRGKDPVLKQYAENLKDLLKIREYEFEGALDN